MKELWIAEGLDPSPQLDEIERFAARSHVRVSQVSRGRLLAAARTDSSQGVIAWADPLEEVPLESLAGDGQGRSASRSPAFLLVIDGVTDPHNLGALLRTAECAGVTGVVLGRHRAAHVTPTVAKVAAGAIEHLAIAVVPGIPSALSSIADMGVMAVGLDAGAEHTVYDLGGDVHGPVALVLGSEGRGISPLARRRCADLVSIPQRGSIGSLNVAAAGAVACFEIARRRSARAPGEA